MKKLIFIVCFLVVVIIFIGCKTSEKQIEYPSNQKVVFIKQYINWSNGFVNKGCFIDKGGNIKEFDFTDKGYDNIDDKDAFISNLENLEDDTIKIKVSSKQVKKYYSMFMKIDKNSNVIKKHTAVDAGQITIYGVEYKSNGTHKLIMIGSEGDYQQKLSDRNAEKIRKWISKIM